MQMIVVIIKMYMLKGGIEMAKRKLYIDRYEKVIKHLKCNSEIDELYFKELEMCVRDAKRSKSKTSIASYLNHADFVLQNTFGVKVDMPSLEVSNFYSFVQENFTNDKCIVQNRHVVINDFCIHDVWDMEIENDAGTHQKLCLYDINGMLMGSIDTDLIDQIEIINMEE